MSLGRSRQVDRFGALLTWPLQITVRHEFACLNENMSIWDVHVRQLVAVWADNLCCSHAIY